LDVLLELGADVRVKDNYDDTPLHTAAGFHRVSSVRSLIVCGADVRAENDSGQTPLAYALARCQNADIAGMVPIAEILLDAGARITPDMAEAVERIGKEFEFHRAGFNQQARPEVEPAVRRGMLFSRGG
jgi:ankyrin repeat protein